ncbi:SDR family oxidoreductase [Luteibacter aegosomatis]|uniref:SDR family oxidoreductase n=1 Tax=Luteibacter aegosomatis TaxID=2911537 RepID=UPI001FFB789C|nr:SDR family oxidoreductase [Luteibacter aegosomatis]UPG87486.1 SDR family oxidoreductase [Luteibacter aegosomatis]
MNILVIGGTGLIGSKVVRRLRDKGHEVAVGSPSSGVDTVSGEGLDAAMSAMDIVVDLANSPSFADDAVLDFFTRSSANIAAAERRAGVKHHLALSVVNCDTLTGSGYMRGKAAQEKGIRDGGIPYTIVRSTQFFEFLDGIVRNAGGGDTITIPTGWMQPIASDDVADAVVRHALREPRMGVVEIGGPQRWTMDELVRRFLGVLGDRRSVRGDAAEPYFGAHLEPASLLPGQDFERAPVGFEAWLEQLDRSRYVRPASA